jgi:Flp pilus assembly protein TadB
MSAFLELFRHPRFPTLGEWLLSGLLFGVVLLLWGLLQLNSRWSLRPRRFWQHANGWAQGNVVLGRDRFKHWEHSLHWAGLPFRPAELYASALALFVLGSVEGYLLSKLFVLALLGGIALAGLPFFEVHRRALKQRHRLVHQVGRMATTLAAEIKTSAALDQLITRGTRAKPPLGVYFAQMQADIRGGTTEAAALEALLHAQIHPALERLVFPLHLLVTQGANVIPMLLHVAEELRKQEQRRVQLDVRLAQARYSFWIVNGLLAPVLVAFHWASPAIVELFFSLPFVLYFCVLAAVTTLIYVLVVLPRTRVENLYQHLEQE